MNRTTSSRRKFWFFSRSLARAYQAWLEKRKRRQSAALQRPLFAESLEPRVLFSGAPISAEQAVEAQANEQQASAQTAELIVPQALPPQFESGIDGIENVLIEQDAAQEADAVTAGEDMASFALESLTPGLEGGLTSEQLAELERFQYGINAEGDGSFAAEGRSATNLDLDEEELNWLIDEEFDWQDDALLGYDGFLEELTDEAIDGIDLLTSVMHEQGQIVGLEEIEAVSEIYGLLQPEIALPDPQPIDKQSIEIPSYEKRSEVVIDDLSLREAIDGIDLLTSVMHEQGQIVGLEEIEDISEIDGLLQSEIALPATQSIEIPSYENRNEVAIDDLSLRETIDDALADDIDALAAEGNAVEPVSAAEVSTLLLNADQTPVATQGATLTLTRAQVEALAFVAAQRWSAAGITAEQRELLRGISYDVRDLDGNRIGGANGIGITIDIDAAGQGWFVDETPLEDTEFGRALSATNLFATDAAAAAGFDLLTTIMHEQGHVLGLADTYEAAQQQNLLFGGFVEGERRLPVAGQADGAEAGTVFGANASLTVTNLLDDGVGSGSLREAIKQAVNGDTITLVAGTYELSITGTDDTTVGGDLDINNKTITIVGAGKDVTFIDANQIDRVFHIYGGSNVTLRDLTVTGGLLNYSHGAGIYADGATLTLDDVKIDNNVVQSTGAGDRHGGGLYLNNATVTGTGVDITNNRAERNGGGNNDVGGGAWINGDSTVTLTDVVITGNTARDGGGFYISVGNFGGSTLNLTNATINNNTGVVRAGGFYNAAIDGRVTVTNGTISGNTAGFEHGGGFYNYAGSVTLSGVTISNNEAQDLDTGDGKRDDSVGGGFYNNTGTVMMTGGAITGNTVYGSGGGFYNRVGTVTIVGTGTDAVEIDNNKAGAHDGLGDSRNGGGFYNHETGTVNLTHTTFSGNNVRFATAGNSLTVTGVGAGFYNTGESTVNLSQVNISNHIAAEGGAFYQDGVKSQVIGTSVTLDNNTAITRGGAFANRSTGATVDLTDSFIRGNTARNEHGGGFYNNGTVELANTVISGNTTPDLDGGVITNLNAPVNPTSTAPNPVQRDGYGAGFYNTGGTITLSGGSINTNQSYGNGGGFVNSGGMVTANGTTISSNTILRDPDLLTSSNYNRSGAGFFNEGDGRVDLIGVTLTNNVLPTDTNGDTRGVGGGFYNSGAFVNISGSTLISGHRAEDGAGFYSDTSGSVVTIAGTSTSKVQIINNVARVRGGAFRSTGGTTVNLEHVDITGNSAEIQRGGAIYADGARIVGSNIKINNNHAGSLARSGDEQGGGLWLDGFARLELTDSEIKGNRTEVNGAGFYAENSVVLLTNTTVADNLAFNSGGGGMVTGVGRIELVDSSITGNIARDNGGGIYTTNDAVITALRSHLDRNVTGYELDGVTRRAVDLRGGGFYAIERAQVNLTDSTLDGNVAAMYGGAGYVGGETRVNILFSTVAENIGGHYGGAFFVESSGNLNLQNSTVSGNWAGFRVNAGGGTPIYVQESVGGAVWNLGGATVTKLDHVTVTNNFASRTDGAGLHVSSGSVSATNSIIFGNVGNAEGASTGTTDTQNAITLIGANVLGTHGGSLLGNTAGRITTNPGLAALAANGGFGRTHAITGVSSAAEAALNSTVAVDQRGQGRPASNLGTVPADTSATGADLLADPNFTLLDPDRTPPLNGTSLLFPAGGADNENLFAYRIISAGEVQADGSMDVIIDYDFTKVTGDQDFVFTLSDGTRTLTWTMIDNGTPEANPSKGSVSAFGQLLFSAGEPAIGVSSTIRFAFNLSAAGSTLTATRGTGESGSASTTTILNVIGGLTFAARIGNAGEQTQVDNIAVSYSPSLEGVRQGSDLGAFEADSLATTLSIDTVTVPETVIGSQSFQVSSVAISTGAGPLTYLWEVRDSSGALLTSAATAVASLTASLSADNPVDTVTISITVTDTATGQVATKTSKSVLMQVDATGATATAGSAIVTTATDVVDGLDSVISLREAINQANASGAGSFVITFDSSLNSTAITAALNSNVVSLNYDTQTAEFAVGETITSSTGGSALIVGVIDSGTAGTLSLINVTGTFNDNNNLSVGGTQRALANGGFYNDDLNLGGDFDIRKTNGPVFIIGNGMATTTIDAGGLDRVFDIGPNAKVFFKDLKITGGVTTTAGNSDHGAGFRNVGGTVVLQNVDLAGNDATRTSDNVGGGFYSTRSGILSGRVAMVGGFIRDNQADSHGGGFYVDDPNMAEGFVFLKDVTISGNKASDETDRTDRNGGGFYFAGTGNHLVAENVIIEDNSTKNDGGGFVIAGADNVVKMTNVTLRRNIAGVSTATVYADNDGGGFQIAGSRNQITITDSTLGGAGVASTGTRTDGNFAEGTGGGFHMTGVENVLNLVGATITGNQSNGDAGGFWVANLFETVNISGNSGIVGNFSLTGHGGGFRNEGVLNITGTPTNPIEISGNHSRPTATGNLDGVGGGFYNVTNGVATLTDVTISDNVAYARGGGFFNAGGGQVFINSSTPGTFKSTITGNAARVDSDGTAAHLTKGFGGGFYNSGATSLVSLTDATITLNTAADYAGGFHTESNFSVVDLTRVSITENSAVGLGGGFHVASTWSMVNLDTVLIDHNVSTTNHGGGFRNNGIINGNNVTITNNAVGVNLSGTSTSTADLVGGGFYNSNGRITLVDVTIDDNYARGRGGGFYTDGAGTIDISSSDTSVFRSTISGNLVNENSRDGGGFYVSSTGNLVRLIGVDIEDNVAGRHGGGFYLQSDGALVELIDVLISGNIAGNVVGTFGAGGGFYNASAFSTITVNQVTISNNRTKQGNAGGFYNRGRLIGQDITVSDNIAGETDRLANNDFNRVGGGFYSSGSESITDLTRVVIKDNTTHGRGGGFYADSSAIVRLTDFIIRGNSTDQGTISGTAESQGRGGGFWISSNADVTLNRGEISENESFGHGGGFYQQDTGSSVALTNATISGNRAGVDQNGSVIHDTVGGGFWAISAPTRVTLDHVTITNNSVNRNGADAGAGFRVDTAGNVVRMSNSIVYGNFRQADTATPIADDVDNRTTTNVDFQLTGNNIIGVRTGNAIGGVAHLTANPGLLALADNGGVLLPGGDAARTHALNLGASGAVDAAIGSTLTEDQRGISRPQGLSTDLGAFEAPGLIYVNDNWTGTAANSVVDGNLETVGSQGAIFGIDAFASVAEVFAKYGSFAGTIVLNGGAYSTVDLASVGHVTLQLVRDLTDNELDVTIGTLTGGPGDAIVTRSLNSAEADLIIEGGDFGGVISGDGNLDKNSAGTLVLSGVNTYTGVTTINGGTLSLSQSAGFASIVDDDGALAHWRLSETAGQAIDVIGGQNGTYNGFLPGELGVSGLLQSDTDLAAEFDGVNNHVSGTFSAPPFGGDWTIETWFVRDDASADWEGVFSANAASGVTLAPLLTFFNAANGNTRHMLGMNPSGSSSTPDIFVDLDQFGGGGGAYLGKTIYAVLSKSGNTLSMHVNVDGTWLPPVTTTLTRTVNGASTSYYIGRHWTGGAQYHDGKIDEVAIYNRALDANEVQRHFEVGSSPSGSASIDATSAISIAGSATLDVSGRSTGGYEYSGEVSGTGAITGDFSIGNGGNLTPGGNSGADVGSVTVNGDLSLPVGGTFSVSINGSSVDKVVVNGGVSIAGNLQLNSISDPTAALITFIENNGTADLTSGAFTSLNGVPTVLSDGASITIGAKTYKLFYNGGDGNDVVLAETTTTPAVIYVDDFWATGINGGQTIADADQSTSGTQDAIFGINAFATLADALAVAATSSTIILNDGDYSSEIVTLAGTQTLEITGPDTAGTSENVKIGSLSAATTAKVIIEGNSVLELGGGTLEGVISGSGSLTKTGTGTLILSGNNTYAGLTSINVGTLKLGHTSGLGSATGKTVIASGATLDFAGFRVGTPTGELVEVAGAGVGGLGAIINTGGSQTTAFLNLRLTGNATFSASNRWDIVSAFDMGGHTLTKIGAGQVYLKDVTITNPGSVDIVAGSLFLETNTDFDGTGTITVRSGANLSFNRNSHTHNVGLVLENGSSILARSFLGVAGAPIVAGPVVLVSGSTTIQTLDAGGGTTSSLAFTGNVSGAGGIIKTGGDTLFLSGSNNTHSGTTTISGGTLQLNGIHTGGGAYSVASTATLGGTGSTTAAVTVNSGGILSPGLTAGDSTDDFASGNLLLSVGSTCVVRLDSTTVNTGYDQIDVTGTVTLGGALQLTAGFTPALSDTFIIIDNDGTADVVTGTFSSLPEGATVTAGGQDFIISYVGGDGNDVVLFRGTPDTNVDLTGGVLTISDINSETADGITISFDGTYYVITDSNSIFSTTGLSGTNINRPDARTVRVLASAVTSLNVVTAGAGAATDTVTIGSMPASIPGSVTISAETINLNNNVTSTGDQTYNGAVRLGANVTAAGQDVTFSGTVNGAFGLTVNTSGNGVTTFTGTVGSTIALASLTTNADGTLLINGGTVTTTGAQTYDENLTLGTNTILAGSTVTFNGNLAGGSNDITINSTTTVLGNAATDTVTGVGTLTTNATGTTTINSGSVVATTLTLNDDVTLGSDVVITATTATFKGNIVGGGNDLTVNATTTTLGDAPGDSITGVGTLTTNAAGATTINTANVSAVTVDFNDTVILTTDVTLTATDLALADIEGPGGLTANVSGTATLGGDLGSTTSPLAFLDIVSVGSLSIANDVNATGTVTLTTAGDLTFAATGTINSGAAVTINADQTDPGVNDPDLTGTTVIWAGAVIASSVTINGSLQEDIFVVTPSVITPITVHGDNPTNLPGDLLSINDLTSVVTTVPPGSGTYTTPGKADVDFTGIERDNQVPQLDNLNLTDITDIIRNPTTTLSGTIRDVGPLTEHILIITWGDGSVEVIDTGNPPAHVTFNPTNGQFTVTHPYAADGIYNVTVETVDSFAASSGIEPLTMYAYFLKVGDGPGFYTFIGDYPLFGIQDLFRDWGRDSFGILEGFRFAQPGGLFSDEGNADRNRPILTLIPTYTGYASPGSVISLRIMSSDGEFLPGGSMTVVADLSGSWIAGFSDLVLGNSPYVIQIEMRAPSWDQNSSSVLHTYFAPSISGSFNESEAISVNAILGRHLSSVAMQVMNDGNGDPQGTNEDWRSSSMQSAGTATDIVVVAPAERPVVFQLTAANGAIPIDSDGTAPRQPVLEMLAEQLSDASLAELNAALADRN